MAAYISRKISWLRCLVSFMPSLGAAMLLCALFTGPRLGPFYDFLLRRRLPPPVSPELLIIDSSVPGQEFNDDILEPGTAASILYTMTELGARTLIIQVPILGLSAGGNVGEAEILYHFDEEFSLLSKNIRNLFDGIRTGSVAPSDAARYVGELVELSDKGKERLVSALVRRDEEGIVSMEKAAAFFGHARRPGDLRVQLIRSGEGDRPGILAETNEYSRAQCDPDGVLRRIAPVLKQAEAPETGERTLEHTVYGALKTRYASAAIENAASGPVLAARNGPGNTNLLISLDRNGALLFEAPHRGEDFRRIGIADFLSYDEADRNLRRLLGEGEALGIYQGIEGENRPLFLYDYALTLREELASSAMNGDGEMRRAWIAARQNYFTSLEKFLYGPAEMKLVGACEEIIAAEYREPDSAGIAGITEMRDALIRSFAVLRYRYNEVLELRGKLESELADSFCILGRGSARIMPGAAETGNAFPFQKIPGVLADAFKSAFRRENPTDTEASAILANAILTGRAVKPGSERLLFWIAIIWAFLTCVSIKSRGPGISLITGTIMTLLIGTGFSLSFVLSGFWLDPLIPSAACFSGVLVSFTWALVSKGRYSRRFRMAFGPFVSHACLRSVIHAGKPLPSQTVTAWAAVVAVRKSDPVTRRDSLDPRVSAQAVLAFQEKVSALFKKAGGTIIGTEGDLVTACFGSPLERVFLKGKKASSPYEGNIHARAVPALRTVDFVSEIIRRPDSASWNFGLDMGNCTFSWTALSGYTALGLPVQRARILSNLTKRYNARIIISARVNEALPDLTVKKLDILREHGAAEGEHFYRLTVG